MKKLRTFEYLFIIKHNCLLKLRNNNLLGKGNSLYGNYNAFLIK